MNKKFPKCWSDDLSCEMELTTLMRRRFMSKKYDGRKWWPFGLNPRPDNTVKNSENRVQNAGRSEIVFKYC